MPREYWPHAQMVVQSSCGRVEIVLLFHEAAMLFYIVQRITVTKAAYFSKTCYKY
jgi:hypothetical protein